LAAEPGKYGVVCVCPIKARCGFILSKISDCEQKPEDGISGTLSKQAKMPSFYGVHDAFNLE